jgi:hypothetical protein
MCLCLCFQYNRASHVHVLSEGFVCLSVRLRVKAVVFCSVQSVFTHTPPLT